MSPITPALWPPCSASFRTSVTLELAGLTKLAVSTKVFLHTPAAPARYCIFLRVPSISDIIHRIVVRFAISLALFVGWIILCTLPSKILTRQSSSVVFTGI